MSVLDTFIRIRSYRDRADEYYRLAAEPFNFDVRERYLAVADHYAALAEAEFSADRVARKRRLQELDAERKRKGVVAGVSLSSSSASRLETVRPKPLYSISGGAIRASSYRNTRRQISAVSRQRVHR
jgi:hypothetical protein